MGEVMDEKMEGELKQRRRTRRTELREMDEGEGVLMKLLIKAQTGTPGVPSWRAAMTTGSHGAARCVNGV